MIKKFLLFFVFLIAAAANLCAQAPASAVFGQITAATTNATCTGTVPASGGAVDQPVNGMTNSMGISVTGTWVATLNIQLSVDHGKTWTASGSTFSSNQQSVIAASGYSDVCVFASAFTSGAATVTFTTSSGAAAVTLSGTPPVTVIGVDPCQSAGVAKNSVFTANITTATTTSIVATSGTTVIYLCGFQITSFDTVSANTFQLEYGTGAACVTTQVPITPVYTTPILAAGGAPYVVQVGFAGQSALKPSAAGSALCIVSTVGTTPVIQATVSFVQQ